VALPARAHRCLQRKRLRRHPTTRTTTTHGLDRRKEHRRLRRGRMRHPQ
jgi:hypothetical protein